MFPVKVGIFVHHLRFEPEAEFHSKGLYPFRKPSNSLGKPLRIGLPVSQACAVAAPLSEPAVIQDKKLNSRSLCGLCQPEKLFLRKIKIRGLPVVD